MASFRFELARPEDDKQLRELLARNAMSGEISLSFRREPSYFDACQLDGGESQTIICREVASDRIVGAGSRSVRERYCEGQAERIGYLSALRLDQEHRRRGLVARGFRFFKGLDNDSKDSFKAKYYVTTIADGNAIAEQTLLGGRAGLPHYRRIATWNTYSVSMRRCFKRRSDPIAGMEVRPIQASELGMLVGYLNSVGSNRNLFPKYCVEDFDPQAGTFRDMKRSQLFAAWEGGNIVGTFGLWDQSSFKQVVVEGYAWWLRCIRLFYNAWAKWKRDPNLPRTGAMLKHGVGSLLVVRNDRADVANLLISEACDAYAKTPCRLLLGFDSRCPLSTSIATRASHVYTTGVYLVSWNPMQWEEYNTNRLIYLELGCL